MNKLRRTWLLDETAGCDLINDDYFQIYEYEFYKNLCNPSYPSSFHNILRLHKIETPSAK